MIKTFQSASVVVFFPSTSKLLFPYVLCMSLCYIKEEIFKYVDEQTVLIHFFPPYNKSQCKLKLFVTKVFQNIFFYAQWTIVIQA